MLFARRAGIIAPALLCLFFSAAAQSQGLGGVLKSIGEVFDEDTRPMTPSTARGEEPAPIVGGTQRQQQAAPVQRAKPKRARDPVLAEIQRLLNGLGYKAGSPDGVMGRRTRRAVRAFQSDNGFTATGEMTERQLQALRLQSSGERKVKRAQTLSKREVITAQGQLSDQGYAPGGVDGQWGRNSQRALEEFRRDAGLPVGGALTRKDIKALRAAAADAAQKPAVAVAKPAPSTKTADETAAETAKAFDTIRLYGVDFALAEPFLEATELTWRDVKPYAYQALPLARNITLTPDQATARIAARSNAVSAALEADIKILHELVKPFAPRAVADNWDIEIAGYLYGGDGAAMIRDMKLDVPGVEALIAHAQPLAQQSQALFAIRDFTLSTKIDAPATEEPPAVASSSPAAPAPEKDAGLAAEIATAKGAASSSAKLVPPADPVGGAALPYHRLAGCEGLFGVGIQHLHLAGKGRSFDKEISFTDICFDPDAGSLTYSGDIDGFEKIRADPGMTQFMSGDPANDPLDNPQIFLGENPWADHVAAKAEFKIFALTRGDRKIDSIRSGYVGGAPFTDPPPPGVYHVVAEIGTLPVYEDKKIALSANLFLQGELVVDADGVSGKLTDHGEILDVNNHQSEMALTITTQNGAAAFSGELTFSNPKIGGFHPLEYRTAKVMLEGEAGRIVGENGSNIYAVGGGKGVYRAENGETYPTWMTISLTAFRKE